MCWIDEFWNIHETFPHFFSKQAKLRQPHRAETADFRFQISNFEICQIAFLMTCRPHKSSCDSTTFDFKILQKKYFCLSNTCSWHQKRNYESKNPALECCKVPFLVEIKYYYTPFRFKRYDLFHNLLLIESSKN